ncbi:hypothetical protein BU24DRAFT_417617 [Aaosphaeria arxii CBS 175.79]|uniref:Uncharacterized protein n=1 Tax=Aaosphaeria arxii CBS 175.79 TaxID=1450172 RepID=A0A6A5Y9S6_9PLEO|nr:uncharacterized protein BU24DRAFT_417617 [Aaosphaeria arxii CBS 175.79]KAF2021973.1 hypothetical protein BU24DRAFT_417617 [Aaosphaeria arxii CBS 175.79]
MATSDSPCRVAIHVKVTDIEGDPLARHLTLGQAFCTSVLSRDFHNQIQPDGYDAVHKPARFDSDEDISLNFLYDLGVKGRLSQDEVLKIPHSVYLASREQGNWNFIPKPRPIGQVKLRARKYPWGGRLEQDMLEELQSLDTGVKSLDAEVKSLDAESLDAEVKSLDAEVKSQDAEVKVQDAEIKVQVAEVNS